MSTLKLRPQTPEEQAAYEARVQELEAEGMTTSDAQGIADLEEMDADGHTDEPWEYASDVVVPDGTFTIFRTHDGGSMEIVATELTEKHAARAVDCVNSLAGHNPKIVAVLLNYIAEEGIELDVKKLVDLYAMTALEVKS